MVFIVSCRVIECYFNWFQSKSVAALPSFLNVVADGGTYLKSAEPRSMKFIQNYGLLYSVK